VKTSLHAVMLSMIVLCCFLAMSCGDDNPVAPASSTATFIQRLDMSPVDQFRSVAVLDDGTILAGGSVQTMWIDTSGAIPDTTYDSDACLIRFEASGDTLWSSVYGEPEQYESVMVVTHAVSNGYVTAGESSPYGPRSDAFCERVLETGETGWSVEINQSGFDTPRDIITTSGGSYVIVGQASSMGGYSAASVNTISQGGTLEWEHAFSFGDTNLAGITVSELPDDNLLVIADAYIRSDPYNELWLLELSPAGELLKTIQTPLTNNQTVVDVALIAEGGYRLIGRLSDDSRSGVFLMTTDTQGAMTSVRVTYLDTNFWFTDGLFTTDGGAILCGTEDDAGLLVKLNAEGEITWEKRFVIAGGEVSLAAVDEHQGGYVVAGYFMNDSFTNRDMLLIRTNGDGEVD
jgi:hypothetical protein